MFSVLRRTALTSMVKPILKSIRATNPPAAQRVLAGFVRARTNNISIDYARQKRSMGEGAARALLSASVNELAMRRRLREQRATCEGEPDLAALLLEEYYVTSLLSTDESIWHTYNGLLQEWYDDLGGIAASSEDQQRAASNSTFNLTWLANVETNHRASYSSTTPAPGPVAGPWPKTVVRMNASGSSVTGNRRGARECDPRMSAARVELLLSSLRIKHGVQIERVVAKYTNSRLTLLAAELRHQKNISTTEAQRFLEEHVRAQSESIQNYLDDGLELSDPKVIPLALEAARLSNILRGDQEEEKRFSRLMQLWFSRHYLERPTESELTEAAASRCVVTPEEAEALQR